MTNLRALVAAVAAAALLPGCFTFGCTAVAARQGLIVHVQPTGGTLPDGTYTITVVADGQKLVATDEVSATAGTGVLDPPDLAIGDKHLYLQTALFSSGGDVEVAYRERGGPATVSIEIASGTQVLGRDAYVPQYQAAYPNGEACGSDGENAQAALELVPPHAQ